MMFRIWLRGGKSPIGAPGGNDDKEYHETNCGEDKNCLIECHSVNALDYNR